MIDILNLLVVILCAGVVSWLVNAYIPMPGIFQMLFNLVIFVAVVIYILQFFGIISPIFPRVIIFT